jgi:hypothetical protein
MKNRATALDGVEVKVHTWPKLSIQQIYFCGFTLNVPVSTVRLSRERPLWVQCFLSDNPERDCYALASKSSDNASRLVIRIRGTNDDGEAFDGVVRAGGKTAVEKLNSIYDTLVGIAA